MWRLIRNRFIIEVLLIVKRKGLCFAINLSFHWGAILADGILGKFILSKKHARESIKKTVFLSLSAAKRERRIRGYFLIICYFTHKIFHYQWEEKNESSCPWAYLAGLVERLHYSEFRKISLFIHTGVNCGGHAYWVQVKPFVPFCHSLCICRIFRY